MNAPVDSQSVARYKIVSEEKAGGVTYTPKLLADFVARQVVAAARNLARSTTLSIFDPSIGHGELLISLLEQLGREKGNCSVAAYGFETDPESLFLAKRRLEERFAGTPLHFEFGNFLEFVEDNLPDERNYSLFRTDAPAGYDFIIANPPYVRTQVMGRSQSQILAKKFGLTGRVDLYFPFILGITRLLKPGGIAGIIVSNRFMTTRSGASVRRAIREKCDVLHVWDLGDTKLFGAAVLPAVLLLKAKDKTSLESPGFTSIYETNEASEDRVNDPVQALSKEGVIAISDGRRFRVRHGKLSTSGALEGVWRIATESVESWLSTVERHTWCKFRDIGKIRVGVKTCADRVFIRSDWQDLPESERPELLRPVATHHIARRFRALKPERPNQILYPHEVDQGRRRPVDLPKYPRSKTYLERHRQILERRKYIIEAGRQWYEIWVPQDPEAWQHPKLVFRDISEKPIFWIDQDGSVVNGDCYWLMTTGNHSTDLLWLAAAVANSSFIERFYDLRFHNKLYAGRRRYMTQYVEQFPLPSPADTISQTIIGKAKAIYDCISSTKALEIEKEVDDLVWQAFGLVVEEIAR
ncbi:MAG: N-6 DNA methylase [Desulfomonilaceae bacterium]